MSDNSSTSDQRAKIAPPRTAPEADVVHAVVPSADPDAPAVTTGGARKKKPKPRIAFEDLPKAVRAEFDDLFDSRDQLKSSMYRRVGDWTTAEDLASAALGELALKLTRGEYNFTHSQGQYVAGIASNLVKKHWDRMKSKPKGKGPESPPEWLKAEVLTDDESDLDGAALNDEFAAFNEMEGIKELFQHCAQTLTEYQIAVFYLHSVCQYPYSDIALMLDRPEGALRVCHKEALDKIRADVVGLADLRLVTRHLAFTTKKTEKVPYAKRIAVASKRFGPQK